VTLAAQNARLTGRLVDSLYVEAMLLADEARAYFDDLGRNDRDSLNPMDRVAFACESLKVTTRLMHVIAWLLTRRALASGEIDPRTANRASLRLGGAAETPLPIPDTTPAAARALIEASIDLYARVKRIDDGLDSPPHVDSPARRLLSRLERSL